MSRRPELYHWHTELASRFPGLSPVFVTLLALWSLGMILARRCGLNTVATLLAPLLTQSFNTVRHHLREFYQEAAAKAGAQRGIKRRDFEVAACFLPLLSWVLSFWKHKRLALALDVTNLGSRWHILCISALCGGIGIPVAWKILPGNQKEAWHPHWCLLLDGLRAAVPDDWQVLVLSDRGLESSRLFGVIVGLNWHPLMRAKGGGKFRPVGWHGWYQFKEFAPRLGARFAMAGTAYKTAQESLACVLLASWEPGYAEPWLLLTDLPVGSANPCWYAYRAWIEQGFKVIKSGGLHWQDTKMTDPQRVERLWLAIAVAVLWMVAIGAVVERSAEMETLGELPAEGAKPQRKCQRINRLFKIGQGVLLAALLRGEPLPEAALTEEEWPEPWHDVPSVTEQEFLSGKTYP